MTDAPRMGSMVSASQPLTVRLGEVDTSLANVPTIHRTSDAARRVPAMDMVKVLARGQIFAGMQGLLRSPGSVPVHQTSSVVCSRKDSGGQRRPTIFKDVDMLRKI